MIQVSKPGSHKGMFRGRQRKYTAISRSPVLTNASGGSGMSGELRAILFGHKQTAGQARSQQSTRVRPCRVRVHFSPDRNESLQKAGKDARVSPTVPTTHHLGGTRMYRSLF